MEMSLSSPEQLPERPARELGSRASAGEEERLHDALAVLERAASSGGGEGAPSTETLQRMIAAAVKVYVARVEQGQASSPLPAAGDPRAPTATDVLVTVTDMLAAGEIELFELGMWQTWGGVLACSAMDGGR